MLCWPAVLLALTAAVAPAQPVPKSPYLRPGTPEVGGIHDLCLIYHGMQTRVPWTAENLLPYVAYVDEQGRPRDRLFDSFLFIEFSTDAGAWLHHYREEGPHASAEDWAWLADAWFREETGLIGLERAVARVGEALGDSGHRVSVVISLPVPASQERAFGPLPGRERALDFASEIDRQAALTWYIDRVVQEWESRRHEHLDLAGFYWLAETIPTADEALVMWTADRLRGLGLRLYWIPYFGGQGVSRWRELGIDACMLQPNHFFMEDPNPQRLLAAAKIARRAGCGIEIEFDARAATSEDFRTRFYAYLDAGVKYGWMNDALLCYYEGGGAVKAFAETPGTGRELYDALYRFVKGAYEPSGRVDLETLTLVEHDNTGNLALAAAGAVIHGGIRLPEHPDLAPEKIIDGDVDNYGGMDGFGYINVGDSFTIELPQAATVARTQTMLWDLDGREFGYRIDTSVDGETWEPAVDKSEGDWTGRQVDRFAPREARYVRFTGLYNSVNALVQVVEFEVYGD